MNEDNMPQSGAEEPVRSRAAATHSPLAPHPERLAKAVERLPGLPWIPVPRDLLDKDPALAELTGEAYRALTLLAVVQWERGSLPTTASAAAKVIRMPQAVVAKALELFPLTQEGGRAHPKLAAERERTINGLAANSQRGWLGAMKRWAHHSPANGVTNASDSRAPTPHSQAHRHRHNVVGEGVEPPEGVERRSARIREEARRLVAGGARVTPIVFGAKVPKADNRRGKQVWIESIEAFDRLWQDGPANLAYQPGASGLIEVDIDNAEGHALAQALGCLAEPTLTVRTPRAMAPEGHPKRYPDALRLTYQRPPGLEFGKVKLAGVLEVFSASGYVLLPPSWSSEYGADYAFIDETQPLPCPPKLANALREYLAAPPPMTVRRGRRDATVFLEGLWQKTGQRVPDGLSQRTVCCPAHDDKTPSLSIGPADDGGVVFHCHAGCDETSILAALGLSMADLYRGED